MINETQMPSGKKHSNSVVYTVCTLGLILHIAIVVGVVRSAFGGHRRPPSPPGMVFRVEAREVVSPLDRFEVRSIERSGPAIAIFAPSTGEFPARLEIYRFPDGRRVEVLVGTTAEQAWREHATFKEVDAETSRFDFDGDGTTDHLVTGTGYHSDALLDQPTARGPDYGVVHISSGRDGRLLFEDEDALEYETRHRAIPLGDVEGDGCSDLALLHPRMNRSSYDVELCDMLLGAKSWVTIVSGVRATH